MAEINLGEVVGKSLEFNWNGTSLGVRQEGETEYQYVDLKGDANNVTDPRNILKDSAMLSYGQPDFPFYLENQTGVGSVAYEDSMWTGKQIRFRCNAGVRSFFRQIIQTDYNGEKMSLGVFYKKITGTRDFIMRLSQAATSSTGLGVDVNFGDTNGWLFRKFENRSIAVTGTILFNIEIDNRTGTDDVEFLFAYPMVTPSETINPVMRDGFSFEIESLKKQIGGVWAGSKLMEYGDSIPAEGNAVRLPPWIITGGASSWAAMVCSQIGISRNYGRGVGGSPFQYSGAATWYANSEGEYVNRPPVAQPPDTTVHLSSFCSWDRISTMIPESFDGVIFVMGGTNDWNGTPIEEGLPAFSDANTTDNHWVNSPKYKGGDYNIMNFKGAVASTIMKIQAQASNAIVVLGTPLSGRLDTNDPYNLAVNGIGKTTLDYANAIKEVAGLMSIPVIDVYNDTGINQLNRTPYFADAVHPFTQMGREALARVVISGLNNIYPKFL